MADRDSNLPLLSMVNISKSFGEVDVLTKIDFAALKAAVR